MDPRRRYRADHRGRGSRYEPYGILQGSHDVLAVSQARKVYGEAKANGVDVTLRLVDPEETGTEHCRHDNPTIGRELLADRLADVFSIDWRAFRRTGFGPLVQRRPAMNPGVDHPRAAVVPIDLYRGHPDRTVATMPVPSSDRVMVLPIGRPVARRQA